LDGSGVPDSARFDHASQRQSQRATEHGAERATATERAYLGRSSSEAEAWVNAGADGSYRRCTPSEAAGDWVHVGANAIVARQAKADRVIAGAIGSHQPHHAKAGAWVRIARARERRLLRT